MASTRSLFMSVNNCCQATVCNETNHLQWRGGFVWPKFLPECLLALGHWRDPKLFTAGAPLNAVIMRKTDNGCFINRMGVCFQGVSRKWHLAKNHLELAVFFAASEKLSCLS